MLRCLPMDLHAEMPIPDRTRPPLVHWHFILGVVGANGYEFEGSIALAEFSSNPGGGTKVSVYI